MSAPDAAAREAILSTLRERFAEHPSRHASVEWAMVEARLEANPAALDTLAEMERTGGEPDVIGIDGATGEVLFVDCVAESPAGRRSCCYDQPALEARRKNKPGSSAMALADEMGVTLLTEDEYHHLQTLGEFDRKTSSWLLTPPELRGRGGAIFGDRRYGRVFIYHNGADSYYAARGFRGLLRV